MQKTWISAFVGSLSGIALVIAVWFFLFKPISIVYRGWSGSFVCIRGQARGNAMDVEISWGYFIIPLAVIFWASFREFRRR